MKRGIDTSDEALALNVIQEVGPGGTYLTHADTFANFRNVFTNTISEAES